MKLIAPTLLGLTVLSFTGCGDARPTMAAWPQGKSLYSEIHGMATDDVKERKMDAAARATWPVGIQFPGDEEKAAPVDPIAWAAGKVIPTIKGPEPGRPSPWRQLLRADITEPIVAAWGRGGSAAWIDGTPATGYRLHQTASLPGDTAPTGDVVASRALRLDDEVKPLALIGAADPESDGPSIAILLSNGKVITASGKVIDEELTGVVALLGINDSNIALLSKSETRIFTATALKGWRRNAEVKPIPHAMVSASIAQDNPSFLGLLAGRSAFGGFADQRGLSYYHAKGSETAVLARPWDKPWIVHGTAMAKGGYISIVCNESGDGDVIADYGSKTMHLQGGVDVPPGSFAVMDHPSHVVVAAPGGIWAIPRASGSPVVSVDPSTIKPKANPMRDMAWWIATDDVNGRTADKIVVGGALQQSLDTNPVIKSSNRQIAWRIHCVQGKLVVEPLYTVMKTIEVTTEQLDYSGSTALYHTATKGLVAHSALVGGPMTTDTAVIWPGLGRFDERVLAVVMVPYDGSQLPGPCPELQIDGSVLLPDGRIVDIKEGKPLIRGLARK